MAEILIVYWRDIPAQVIAKTARRGPTSKRELSHRFAAAIDIAAMRDGAKSADDYLSEWRKSSPVSCGDDLDLAAEELADKLEREYSNERIKKLVQNQGREADK